MNATTPAPAALRIQSESLITEDIRPASFLVADNRLVYNGYTIERRFRKAPLDFPEGSASPDLVDVAYVVIKKHGKAVSRFDADLISPLGNSAKFGMFPFLGGTTKQLFISQDLPRAGCQWIVSLAPHFRIIFDGERYRVGREGEDLSALDLDGDGVLEITVPVTDFYDLQDKMSMYQIPLPVIIFRYDPEQRKYLPANPRFQSYLLKDYSNEREISASDQLSHRSQVLKRLLTLVYAGKEQEGWAFYERAYKLDDKREIRSRVESIFLQQPVYRFIYNRRGHE